MHPITAETPFHRLWPQNQQRRRPAPKRTTPPPEPAPTCEHDFLLLTARPDITETTGPVPVTAHAE
jgi:hypothetical protein